MALFCLRNVSLAFGGPRLLDERLAANRARGAALPPGPQRRGQEHAAAVDQGRNRARRRRGDSSAGAGRLAFAAGGSARSQAARSPTRLPSGLREQGHQALESDHRVQAVVSRLGLDPDARFEELSSGMKRRVLLARALVIDPDILLLDEPTNHLDIDSIRWLETFLLRYSETIIFVTHDRVFPGEARDANRRAGPWASL